MAEGGEQVSGRKNEEFIRNCIPCLRKGTENAAVEYCLVCERFFCQKCTELHNSLLEDHRLIEIESEDVRTALTSQSQMETCPEHGKVQNLYCTEDEVAGCEMCIEKEHATCKEAVYLPKAAKEFLKGVDVDDVHAQIRKTIEQLESIKLKQETTMSSLEADRGQCMKQIDDHHTKLLNLMDKIVASSKDTIETTFQRFRLDLQRHQHAVEKNLVDLEESEIRLKRNQGNDVRMFVELKKYQKQSKTIGESSTVSLENLMVHGFNVAVDNRLLDLFAEIGSLVTVLKRAPVKIKEKYVINMTTDDAKYQCSVFGVCVLDDGSAIVPDNQNDKINHISINSRNIIDQCAMQASPNLVCCVNHNEIAVTQANSTVAFVYLKPRLTPTRTISMDHYCGFITYSHEQMFINDEKKTIYIYDMAGSLLRKIGTRENVFSSMRHVVLNDEGDKLYVADPKKGLVTMDSQGNVLDKLVSDQIKTYQGVCLDGTGGLFVCGYDSNNVIHVGADGHILAKVLTSSDGLKKPTSVCFDRVRKRLIVTQFRVKHMYIHELE